MVRTIGDLLASLDRHARLIAYTQIFHLGRDFAALVDLKFSQLLKILSYFPRLKSFELDGVNVLISPSDGLGVLSTLETFDFVNTTQDFRLDVGHLPQFLAPFSAVWELLINCMLLLPTAHLVQEIALPHFQHLSSLAIGCDPTTGVLVEIIEANVCPNLPSLQHLEFAALRPEYVAHAHRLCASLGSRLICAVFEFDLKPDLVNSCEFLLLLLI